MSAPAGVPTLERINHLTATCRAAGIPVLHTSHILRPDGSNQAMLGHLPEPLIRGEGRTPFEGAGRLEQGLAGVELDQPPAPRPRTQAGRSGQASHVVASKRGPRRAVAAIRADGGDGPALVPGRADAGHPFKVDMEVIVREVGLVAPLGHLRHQRPMGGDKRLPGFAVAVGAVGHRRRDHDPRVRLGLHHQGQRLLVVLGGAARHASAQGQVRRHLLRR